ncbi:MAG: plasmid mobilization relaxosome protein MobC [Oscillospiraceae bacterium]|nr:plasmid mobilization relaxosome protein MobC [Oscillospiraceae bacterium]
MNPNDRARIHITVPSAEKEKIEQSAAALHMTMTDYIRACCLRKRVMDTSWVPEITKQIVKIGVNVNQIAAVANTNHSVSDRQIDLVNENLIGVQNQLRAVIEHMENPLDRNLNECRQLLLKISEKLNAMEWD